MYRNAPNGRVGDNMIAISHVDFALWDIKGKYPNQPVHALLGGPVQEKVPAYASTAGFSPGTGESRRAGEDDLSGRILWLKVVLPSRCWRRYCRRAGKRRVDARTAGGIRTGHARHDRCVGQLGGTVYLAHGQPVKGLSTGVD